MAKAQKYNEGAHYDVRLSRPVKVGAFKYLPRDAHVMRGKLLNKINDQGDGDAIARSELRK